MGRYLSGLKKKKKVRAGDLRRGRNGVGVPYDWSSDLESETGADGSDVKCADGKLPQWVTWDLRENPLRRDVW